MKGPINMKSKKLMVKKLNDYQYLNATHLKNSKTNNTTTAQVINKW